MTERAPATLLAFLLQEALILALLLFLWNVGSNIWLFKGRGRWVFE